MLKFKPFKIHSARILRTVTAALILQCSGCIVYRGAKLSAVTQFPPVASKKSVGVDFTYSSSINGRAKLVGLEAAEKEMAGKCIRRLEKSGLFGEISTSVVDPDLRLQINMEDVGEGSSFWMRMSGFTLCLIPCRAKDTFKISATLIDVKNNRRREVKIEEDLTMWVNIIFLPLVPFNQIDSKTEHSINMCFDNLALEIEKTGMLK